MSEIYKHFEPEAEARAISAREMAERIFSGNYKDFDEALMFLRWVISRHYLIPMFDPYFKDRTLDDLVFESELIRLANLPPDKAKTEVVNANKKEAEQIFDDWEDTPEPIQDTAKIDEMAKQFMATDKFTTE